MIHIKVPNLTEVDHLKMEKDYHNNVPTRNYHIRCKSILLKSSRKSVSQFTEMFDVIVPTIYA